MCRVVWQACGCRRVYDEYSIRKICAYYIRSERSRFRLQPCAVEYLVKLVESSPSGGGLYSLCLRKCIVMNALLLFLLSQFFILCIPRTHCSSSAPLVVTTRWWGGQVAPI